MNVKPTYIATLNAIANGERRAYEFLETWSRTTPNPEIRRILHTVALRVAEHAASFEKRINELGFELVPTEDDDFARTMHIASSGLPDSEKFVQLGVGQPRDDDGDDRLLQVLADHTIDPHTGALLGRFIVEKRDSVRPLEGANALASGITPAPHVPQSDRQETLADIRRQLAALSSAVSELHEVGGK